MALIKCSNCGKMISDKAKNCPQCEQPVVLDTSEVEVPPQLLCEECGTPIPENVDSCPNCGCPVSESVPITDEAPQKVEVTSVKIAPSKNAKKIVVSVIALILVLVVSLVAVKTIKDKKQAEEVARQKEEYATNFESTSYMIIVSAAEAESAANLIKRVWYNTIYEKYEADTAKYTHDPVYTWICLDDFNEALSNLFSDPSFNAKLQSIETSQETITESMKDLRNPPEGYEDAYNAIKELYDAYTKLANLATNPTGNLTTYSSNFTSADTEVSNKFEALKMYLD